MEDYIHEDIGVRHAEEEADTQLTDTATVLSKPC